MDRNSECRRPWGHEPGSPPRTLNRGGMTMLAKPTIRFATAAATVIVAIAPLQHSIAQQANMPPGCSLLPGLSYARLVMERVQECTVDLNQLSQTTRVEIRSAPSNGSAEIQGATLVY